MQYKSLTQEVVQMISYTAEDLPFNRENGAIELPQDFTRRFTSEYSLDELLSPVEDVLGTYTPMSSFGIITFNYPAICSFFWHLISYLKLNQGLTVHRADLNGLATLVVSKTYHHEFFHFFCDIQRRLHPSSQFDHLREEALAVAYSALKIEEEQKRRKSKAIPEALFSKSFQKILDYKSPGYKEWNRFLPRRSFIIAVANYINPQNLRQLERNGVAVDILLEAQLKSVYSSRVDMRIKP